MSNLRETSNKSISTNARDLPLIQPQSQVMSDFLTKMAKSNIRYRGEFDSRKIKSQMNNKLQQNDKVQNGSHGGKFNVTFKNSQSVINQKVIHLKMYKIHTKQPIL